MHCSRCLGDLTADPTVTRNDDGTVTLNWPENEPDVALITRDLMVPMVDQHNRTVTLQANTVPVPHLGTAR